MILFVPWLRIRLRDVTSKTYCPIKQFMCEGLRRKSHDRKLLGPRKIVNEIVKMTSEITFNIDCGYLEGLVRGFKGGILKQADYLNLVQCETLEG